MKNLQFCPECGEKSLVWDGEKKWSCPRCSFQLYNNVAGAVAVAIRWRDEIMFTKRNQEPMAGKLDLAGGFVDLDESAEMACQRELCEELSIRIEVSKLRYLASLPNIYEYRGILYHTLDLFFEYEVEDKFETNLEISEISEVLWIPKDEINIEDLAFDSQKKFFAEYLH